MSKKYRCNVYLINPIVCSVFQLVFMYVIDNNQVQALPLAYTKCFIFDFACHSISE